MTVIEERDISLTFSDDWSVIKYDDHRWYRKYVEPAKGQLDGREERFTAVDVIARSSELTLLIEIKDLRGHRIESQARVKYTELAVEFMIKVRDTLAGLVGGARCASEPEPWRELMVSLTPTKGGRPRRLSVVLLLAHDHWPDPKQRKEELNTLADKARQLLRWLTPDIHVIAPAEAGDRFPGLSIGVKRRA